MRNPLNSWASGLSRPRFDVVIAGASFAGLAAAQRLRGRSVALVDRAPLGAGVTSACAAPVSIVEAMGAAASVQQVHDRLVIHTPSGDAVWPLPEPFCTFDYRRFCETAFAQTDAQFVQDAVIGRAGSTVHTASGTLSGRVLVDATGWRAALIGGPSSPYVNRRWMAFGIESEVELDFEPGLHFYFLPEVRGGYAWAFPCGGGVRFGVLSYLGRTKLSSALVTFMRRFGLRPRGIHGGYIASGLREPVVDEVFIAGDASGHCLPLTGEGIRTAVLGGFTCGDLLRGVLDGTLAVEEAAAAYRAFAGAARRKFRALLWGNIAVLALPLPAVGLLAHMLARPRPLQWIMHHYLAIFQVQPIRLATNTRATS